MRETCARAVAAALLTAAIATVVGMSAFFDTPSDAGRPILAPPSSLQSTVRLTAHLAPPHRSRTLELVSTHTNRSTPVRTEAITRSVVAVRRKHRPARRQLAAVSPAPAPPPAPAPAPAPAPPAPVSPAPPSPPPAQDQADEQRKGNGHGHAYGHEKQDQ